VRQWARKFGQQFANRIRRRLPRIGDKWHLDEVVVKIAGVKHWLWRAVDQTGIVLDVWSNADATSKRPSGCYASVEEANASAPRHDHRQACQLRRQTRGHARH